MKKLLLLFLLVAGGVSTASAWGDMYLICYENKNWSKSENASDFKFTSIDSNNFKITVPGSYASSGNWHFRFREKDSDTWYNVGPESVTLDVTNTAQYVSKNGNDTYSFEVAQGTYTNIQIYISWNDSKWHVSAVTGGTCKVAFNKPSNWGTLKAYMYLEANSATVKYLGDWNGTTVNENATSNIYNLDVPNISGSKIIFSDGSNRHPASGGLDVSADAVFDTSSNSKISSVNVSAGTNGVATYSSAYPLDFSDTKKISAYTVSSLSSTSATLTMMTQNVPAKTGLIIKGSANANEDITPVAAGTSVGTNYLHASVIATEVNDEEAYVLSSGVFHLVNGDTIPANKAYLLAEEVSAAGASRTLSLVFDGETTGISQATNDQWLMGTYYDLSGRRVAQPTKGLYIVNGKKVIIK